MVYHGRDLRKKATGGRRKKYTDKKKWLTGRHFASTKVGKTARAKKKIRGKKTKISEKYAEYANVVMPDNTMKRAKIDRVVESPSNRHYARMHIITKGAIISTELGNAVVTSRPGQHGIINAKLVKEEGK